MSDKYAGFDDRGVYFCMRHVPNLVFAGLMGITVDALWCQVCNKDKDMW